MKRVNFLNGLGLLILSIVLFFSLPPFVIYLGAKFIFQGKLKFKNLGPYLGRILKTLAILVDILGNVLYGSVFNYVLIQENSRFKFESWRNTISEVLGINEWDETLTPAGLFLVKVLDFLDDKHCWNSIQDHNKNKLINNIPL